MMCVCVCVCVCVLVQFCINNGMRICLEISVYFGKQVMMHILIQSWLVFTNIFGILFMERNLRVITHSML